MNAKRKRLLVMIMAGGLTLGAAGMAVGGSDCGWDRGGRPGMERGDFGGRSPDRRMDSEERAERMYQRLTDRLIVAHERLGISAEQESAWENFERVVTDGAKRMMEKRTAARDADKGKPDMGIEERIRNLRETGLQMQTLADAADRLYGVLSPEQREQAEDLLPLRGGKRGGGPGPRHMSMHR